MNRLFTFGCSFTKYHWPTWADILGCEFDEHYNYGLAGAGNLYITTSIAEAIARYNITSTDTVMVMWSNVTREDRYLHNGWNPQGNIFNQTLYSKDFIDKFVTVRGCYVRDLPFILLTKKTLDGIGCKYEFMSIVDIDTPDQYTADKNDNISDLLKLYQEPLLKIKPSVHKILFNYDYGSRPFLYKNDRPDYHPFPLEHLEYINKVLPEYKIGNDTLVLVNSIDKICRQHFENVYNRNNNAKFFNYWDDKAVRMIGQESSPIFSKAKNIEIRL